MGDLWIQHIKKFKIDDCKQHAEDCATEYLFVGVVVKVDSGYTLHST